MCRMRLEADYIEAELEVIDSTRYYPKIVRQEYTRPQFAEQRPRS